MRGRDRNIDREARGPRDRWKHPTVRHQGREAETETATVKHEDRETDGTEHRPSNTNPPPLLLLVRFHGVLGHIHQYKSPIQVLNFACLVTGTTSNY